MHFRISENGVAWPLLSIPANSGPHCCTDASEENPVANSHHQGRAGGWEVCHGSKVVEEQIWILGLCKVNCITLG